jgi:hypothetical protein
MTFFGLAEAYPGGGRIILARLVEKFLLARNSDLTYGDSIPPR